MSDTNAKPIRVLLVDDDPDYAEIVRFCLCSGEDGGPRFVMETAETLAAALEAGAARPFDAALVDLTLPDASGLQAPLALLSRFPGMPVLVATGVGDEELSGKAIAAGAQDYIAKAGFEARHLKRALRYAISRKAAQLQCDEILRASADGLAVVDASGMTRFVNAAAEKILGKGAGELLGRPFPHPAAPGEAQMLQLPREGGPPASVDMRVSAIHWEGAPASLAALRDVSGIRRLDQLMAEIAERRRTDEAKDRWLGTIAHELRTPLTIIKGAAIDLHEGQAEPLRPQQAMLVGLVRRQAERVERLVANLLDLGRLQSGVVSARRAALDPGEIVRRVVGDFSRAAADRAVVLDLVDEGGSRRLAADPELFEQLVVNLVDNAIRFARTRITVRVGGDEELLALGIEDDGVGIPAEKRERLFSRYGQLERRREVDGYKGTGLGLAICKEIVNLHRGTIEAESEPGRGTVFSVRLPRAGKEARV
jgi:signal transduction histidine kinase/DNA-binding NarL/FixJ family response regulator